MGQKNIAQACFSTIMRQQQATEVARKLSFQILQLSFENLYLSFEVHGLIFQIYPESFHQILLHTSRFDINSCQPLKMHKKTAFLAIRVQE